MSAVFDDRPDRAEINGGAYRGKIATNASGLSDEVFVTVTLFHSQLRYGPCRWMPFGDSVTYPTRGDDCIVMFDDVNTPFIVAWWPS